MEQSGKDKKPFVKKNGAPKNGSKTQNGTSRSVKPHGGRPNNRPNNKTNNRNGRRGAEVLAENAAARDNAAAGKGFADAADSFGISRELMENGRAKKRHSDYSSSSGLIESFEAEESKNGISLPEKRGTEERIDSDYAKNFDKALGRVLDTGVKKHSDRKSNKGSDRSGDKNSSKDSDRGEAKGFSKGSGRKDGAKGSAAQKNSSQNNAPRKNAQQNKSGKGARRNGRSAPHDHYDDLTIKTIENREYIPVDYSDDDIIPEDYYFSDFVSEEIREGGVKSAGKIRREAALPGAVIGRNAVRELLRSDRSVDKLYVKNGAREGSIVVIVAEAVSRKIPVVEVSQDKLDALSGGANHQGVVALAAEKQYTDIESILKIAEERGEKPLVVIADGIEDPQNLGALIRCAECAGVHGIIIPKRRAVGLTPAVTKASAGALEHMAIAKVSNIADAVEKLKKAGLWVFAAEAGGTPYYDVDFNVPAAVVLGSEGFGVSRLIKEKSDFTVSIPMYGHVNSLNVATAASVILCHAAKAHHS